MCEHAEQAPSPDVPPRNRTFLTHEDVKEVLEQVFPGAHELWANEVWAALIKLDLANYSNELERCEAAIRFIAFTEFYRDWQALVDEGDRGFTDLSVPAALGLTAFRLGQLIGRHPDFIDDPRFDPYTSLGTDDELFRRALYHLEMDARPAVVSAIEEHFGGISGLLDRKSTR